MLTISIKPDPSIDQWSASLQASERQIQTATIRALNKTGRWLRPTLARETAQALSIKVGLVKQWLTLMRARRHQPQLVVGLLKRAGVINAIDLGKAQQTATGTRVGRRHWDQAFIATMPGGHRGVFRRRGKSRLPIREETLVFTGRLREAMQTMEDGRAIQQFKTLYERELRFLRRIG